MSPKKRIIVAVAIYLVLLLAFFVVVNGFPLHRREFDQAFFDWLHNPNPQTESLLHAQSNKTLIINLEDSAEAALVFWIAGFTCYPNCSPFASQLGEAHRHTRTRITSK